MESKFKDCYKNSKLKETKISERRKKLLQEQKDQRNQIADTNRGFLNDLRKDKDYNVNYNKYNKNFCDKLQLSVWLTEQPDDFESWFLVPCPKGIRCLIVASEQRTVAYNKHGYVVKRFRSNLPGDSKLQHGITTLDAVYDSITDTFYILDVLTYGYQDMTMCETMFRFYWRTSKIDELRLNMRNSINEIPLIPIPFYDLENDETVSECLSKYPQFPENSPELDGLLFYHKESSYVHGVSPLVGWLYPFMLDEVLQTNYIMHDNYRMLPDGYTNYMDYIEIFNRHTMEKKKKQSKRMNRHWKKSSNAINGDDVDFNDEEDVYESGRILEMDGIELGADVHDEIEMGLGVVTRDQLE